MAKLTARKVENLAKRGMYPDGDGLYLQITGPHAKSWIYRFSFHGRERYMGLDSYPHVSLAEAREARDEARRLRKQGIDPIDHRRKVEREAAITARREQTRGVTFDQCAERFIASHEDGWRNGKHRQQWRNTLASYVLPVMGQTPVQDIDTALVMRAIEPLWRTRPETASRVRGRIEAVLDWAKVNGFRDGENPARWRGHLNHLLPARSKVRRVKHHPALPYMEMPAFVAELRKRDGLAALALEFLMLTAARTGELLGASWDEFDLDNGVWTVSAERMKARREHRVPLSARAIEILRARQGDAQPFPLSSMALLMLLRRMGRKDITAHGFRSSFRDWAAERTNFPNEVVEMALAHTVADAVEAAYRRGDLFDRRRALMDAWAKFSTAKPKAPAVVVSLRGRQ